jgi:hypothetical protein
MTGVLGALIGAGGVPGVINGSLPSGVSTLGATAGFTIQSNGTYNISTGQLGNWVTPASGTIAALYQVKVDPTSGSFTGGAATGTWLDCSTTRGWNLDPDNAVTFTISFREKATGIVRSVQTGITLTAFS